jgi:hypothetical protein
MAFGFPASAEATRVLRLPQGELAQAVRNALAALGWCYREISPAVFEAKTGVNLWSWGESVRIVICPDGAVQAVSQCSFLLQCIDWGKNQRNLDRLFSQLGVAASP